MNYDFSNFTKIENEEFKFYDLGWNAYCRGEPFNKEASKDWRDGWRDCSEAPGKDQQLVS